MYSRLLRHISKRQVQGTAALLGCVALPSAAEAHVKWFCAFDVAGQPRGLESVLCPDFELLIGLSIAVLVGACLLESTPIGNAMLRSLDRVTGFLNTHVELIIRAVTGFFLVALWTMGGILLTPELRTQSEWVPLIQLGMAACLLTRPTLPLAALGIVGLFVKALCTYGAFHLMNYPIFLGVAGYLALVGLGRTFFGVRPMDILRWSAAVTLMWASIEKWAYPEWTFPLFVTHAKMTLGYDREFFMRAAGAVEFTLAFSLLWTPLVRRGAAIMLTATFVSAIGEFGKIDAIGHAPIIAVLIAIAADPTRTVRSSETVRQKLAAFRPALTLPIGYATALIVFLGLYYAIHSAMFGTTIL